ncbi:hypothetical protein ACNOYE_26125 [Nannocystaceae bacterium ST9]
MAALVGCGSEDEAPPIKPSSSKPDLAVEASERVESFVSAPDYAGLIGMLAQPHALARELLGPHELHYEASFYTGPNPEQLALDQPLPDVGVDEPIVERFAIHDQLDLRWLAAPGGAPHFSLSQRGGEPNASREVIVIGEQTWAQVDERGWFGRELDGDLWTLWLDDAQHAVLDAVELAGPRLALGPVETTELGGRSALKLSLSRGDTLHADRVVEPPHAWRGDASLDAISGELVIDRASGLWLSAKIDVVWSFRDSAGRDVFGSLRLEASVEPLPDSDALRASIAAPEGAKPLPERDRPELLRERLLDGLAAP